MQRGGRVIVSVDPGTLACGWACFSESGHFVESGCIRPKGEILQRIAALDGCIAALLIQYRGGEVSYFAYEAPYLGPNAKSNVATNAHLGELRGRLIARAEHLGYIPLRVQASEWRRSAGIRKGQGKSASVRQAQLKLGRPDIKMGQDEAEAILIGYYAAGKVRLEGSAGIQV